MGKLGATVAKELRILLRDRAGLLILFLMPAVLVVVISLVQENVLKGETQLRLLIAVSDQGPLGKALQERIGGALGFETTLSPDLGRAEVRQAVVTQAYQFGVFIPPGADRTLVENAHSQIADALAGAGSGSGERSDPEITLYFDPTVRGVFRTAVRNGLEGILSGVRMQLRMEALTAQLPAHLADIIKAQTGIDLKEALTAGKPSASWAADTPAAIAEVGALAGFSDRLPTTVQQNVPAWALFGMFFIVVPLAGSLIQERNDMTLVRLLTLPVSYLTVATGKVIAYVLICLLQFAIIGIVGKTLLPALGTPVLEMGGSPAGILLITICAGLAASGFGILLGTVSRSYEQAAMFGSISIVIAAALGGILVPVYVMPRGIQQISAFSPLSWGLEGYLDLFVRNGTLADVLPEAGLLLAFFAATVLAAWIYFNRRRW